MTGLSDITAQTIDESQLMSGCEQRSSKGTGLSFMERAVCLHTLGDKTEPPMNVIFIEMQAELS